MGRKRKPRPFDRPTIKITGKEKDAFDFIPLVRKAYREQNNYRTHYEVVKGMTHTQFWKNTDWLLTFLKKYCNIEA